ncbi:MAG: GTPase ObgE [Bacteroidetes bacterium CG12_big_fil_rev_8_21_14_0_65_60_17]|nr:MAG: GTPase ObgE [Bacteroidetes bacterium CG12_big_fil_rev_8_21_14_0_65_60_17]
MKFVDYVTISVKSGDGGAGAMSFRRAKYEPKGGPDGGDGGRGGSVMLLGDSHLYTLLDLRYNRHHHARNGGRGEGANKTGKDGEDIVLRVPLGTVARNSETGELVGEITDEGDVVVLATGGRGGKGNTFFKSPTNRAPRHAQPGEPGEELELTLELKLLADVGLVGFPNAGKSTLVSSLSAAKPKIADYPFTTLEPSLGVVSVGSYESFVMADIPGIIEGAHEGKGLGIRFLKHIERNAVLLLLIPVTSEDPAAEYRTLRAEMAAFNPELAGKPHFVAASKVDVLPEDEVDDFIGELRRAVPEGVDILPISSVARNGLDTLKTRLWREIQAERAAAS